MTTRWSRQQRIMWLDGWEPVMISHHLCPHMTVWPHNNPKLSNYKTLWAKILIACHYPVTRLFEKAFLLWGYNIFTVLCFEITWIQSWVTLWERASQGKPSPWQDWWSKELWQWRYYSGFSFSHDIGRKHDQKITWLYE